MNVYLLRVAGWKRPVFYAEIPPGEDEEPDPTAGRRRRTWLDRQWRALQARLKRAVRQAGPRIRRLWAWLDRRPPPDESLLRVLRTAADLQVIHPAAMTGAEARHAWGQYLARRWRQHLGTFAWDLAVSPLIALLMVLPGPNVIGYWFLYRLITHLLAMRGVLRVRMKWVATEFRADAALDGPIRPEGVDEQARRLAEAFALKGLGSFLRRLAERRAGRPSTLAGVFDPDLDRPAAPARGEPS